MKQRIVYLPPIHILLEVEEEMGPEDNLHYHPKSINKVNIIIIIITILFIDNSKYYSYTCCTSITYSD